MAPLLAPRRIIPVMLTLLLAGAMATMAHAQSSGNNNFQQNSTNVQDFTKDSNTKAEVKSSGSTGKEPELKGYTMTPAKIGDLMGKGEQCMVYKHPGPLGDPTGATGTGKLCCKMCKDPDPTKPLKCCPDAMATQYTISYEEPSAIVEVSCRSGYSMLTPGAVQSRGNNAIQSCVGFNKPGNSRWFFEARVWAVNGYDGGVRHQSAMGSTNGERARQCTEVGDDTTKSNYWGYGQKKWDSFPSGHGGSGSGPGGSWEAYISDKDPSWAKDEGGTPAPSSFKECSTTDVEACWGPMSQTGWVSHPNPTLAAALVAWRAHTKALGMKKVSSDLGAGYKMAMDFPFPTYSGAHASSMGKSGNSKVGSECFEPGNPGTDNPGPNWNGQLRPEAIPDFIKGLKQGTVTATADMNSGIYIFTFWVKTKCVRYQISGGKPVNVCKYADLSPSGSQGGAPVTLVVPGVGTGDLSEWPPYQPPSL